MSGRCTPDSLLDRMVGFIEPTGVFEDPRMPLLVAASGGADSTAMVALLEAAIAADRLHGIPVLAHLDHALRPNSGVDRRRVEALASRFGRALEVEVAEDGSIGQDEDSARRARRDFLFRAANRIGTHTIVLGHHADDQAETVLHRIFRGTGVTGLAAMSPVSEQNGVRLVRPLLFAVRAELREWLTGRDLDWADDPTNADPDRARGHLRHTLLPALPEAIYPAAVRNLTALSERARETSRYIESQAHRALEQIRIDPIADRSIALSRAGLQAIDGALLHPLLAIAMTEIGGPAPTAETRRQVERGVHSGGDSDLPGGVRLVVDRDRVEFVVGQRGS